MSDKLRAAAQAALSAMSVVRVFVTSKEKIKHPEGTDWYDNIISNLEAALAEPTVQESLTVAEPVAWMSDRDVGFYKEEFGTYPCVPLYTDPPRREWVGLTDKEILRLYQEHAKYQEEGMKLSGWNAFATDVQAKLREKNT